MQGKGITKTTFEQLFEAVSTKSFSNKLIDLGVDKYVKKLHTIKFLNDDFYPNGTTAKFTGYQQYPKRQQL